MFEKMVFFGLLRVPIMALLRQPVYLVSLVGFVLFLFFYNYFKDR